MILLESSYNIVTEQEAETKNLYLKGIFMEAETVNKNGRKYRLSEMADNVNRINKQIKDGYDLLGELDHPDDLTVKLSGVSHKITELKMNGNAAYGKALILPTPKGLIAKGLIESGIKLGVSSRGSGSIDDEGIVEEFQLITIDIVANPSAPNAYPQSVYEHLEMYKRGYIVTDLAESLREDKSAQKYFDKEIGKFIEKLFSNNK